MSKACSFITSDTHCTTYAGRNSMLVVKTESREVVAVLLRRVSIQLGMSETTTITERVRSGMEKCQLFKGRVLDTIMLDKIEDEMSRAP